MIRADKADSYSIEPLEQILKDESTASRSGLRCAFLSVKPYGLMNLGLAGRSALNLSCHRMGREFKFFAA